MDHLSLFSDPESQIKTGVKFASGTLAARLPAGALHGHEAAAEEGLIVKDLSETGPGPPFRIRQMASRTHKDHLLCRDLYLIYYYLSDIKPVVKQFLNANLLGIGRGDLSYGIHGGFAKKKYQPTEFLSSSCPLLSQVADFHLKWSMLTENPKNSITGSYPRTDTLKYLKNRQSINQQVDGTWQRD